MMLCRKCRQATQFNAEECRGGARAFTPSCFLVYTRRAKKTSRGKIRALSQQNAGISREDATHKILESGN